MNNLKQNRFIRKLKYRGTGSVREVLVAFYVLGMAFLATAIFSSKIGWLAPLIFLAVSAWCVRQTHHRLVQSIMIASSTMGWLIILLISQANHLNKKDKASSDDENISFDMHAAMVDETPREKTDELDPSMHSYKCKFSGHSSLMSCKTFLDAQTNSEYECVPDNKEMYCRDKYIHIDPDTRINNWKKDGLWSQMSGGIALITLNNLTYDEKSKCATASLGGSDIHLCNSSHQRIISPEVDGSSYRGYVKMSKYEQGFMRDDLHLIALEMLADDAFEDEEYAIRLEQALNGNFALKISEKRAVAMPKMNSKQIYISSFYDPESTDNGKQTLLYKVAEEVKDRLGGEHVRARLNAKGIDYQELSSHAESYLDRRERAINSMSNLQRAHFHGWTAKEFDEFSSNKLWSMHKKGTKSCEGEDLSKPGGANEFARQRLLEQRDDIARSLKGRNIAFYGAGNARKGIDLGAFTVEAQPYDFRNKKFRIVISAKEHEDWPIGATNPKVGVDSYVTSSDVRVGSIGGRDVKVRASETERDYYNASQMTIDIPMAVDIAESYESNMPIEIFVVLEYVGEHYHKKCQRVCSTFLGVSGCSTMNVGYGALRRAKTLGYEVFIDGEIVAQKQPK